MEAKIKKREICDTVVMLLESSEIQLDYRFKSLSDFSSNIPSSLVINYDGEITEEIIKSVITSYSGDYKVFHTFKTNRFFLSDITQFMKEIFNIEGGKNE